LVLVIGKWLAARKTAARKAAAPAGVAPATAAAAGLGGALRRVLLAVDGSEGAAQAVRRLLALRSELRDSAALQVHLINVQRPVSGDVARFVPGQTLEDYHRERSDKALAPARALLDAAGLAHQDLRRVGDPGETIAQAARELGSDLIVMGARGLASHTAALLGSVAQSTIEHAAVPVLVVK
jgi:nucleotide-binding universal stress UspA family protein